MASSSRPHEGETAPARPLAGPDDALRLFKPIAGHPREMLAFAYFDPEWRLLGLRHSPSPAIDAIRLCPRGVARDALAFDARLVVMVHNHPTH